MKDKVPKESNLGLFSLEEEDERRCFNFASDARLRDSTRGTKRTARKTER